MKNNVALIKKIKSYVKREGRLTKSQLYGLENYWAKHGIDYNAKIINLEKVFKRYGPIILDIGVGAGESTINQAISHPENNYLAVEVHRPGIGRLLNKIEEYALTNIKIIKHDVTEVLKEQIPNRSLTQIFIFFPDPWPKKRHHKRRLINKELIRLVKKKLVMHGRLHIATDWEDYANHIREVGNNDPSLINLASCNNFSPRPLWRTETRYEFRGKKLDHKVWDLCYGLK
tara:strand:+ start:840 stop:1529 length:690 start_codon:yes stop_codon:yes gene_type:complete